MSLAFTSLQHGYTKMNNRIKVSNSCSNFYYLSHFKNAVMTDGLIECNSTFLISTSQLYTTFNFQWLKRLLKTFLFRCWNRGALWLIKLWIISFLTYLFTYKNKS